jgi:hypothetical protein
LEGYLEVGVDVVKEVFGEGGGGVWGGNKIETPFFKKRIKDKSK